MNEKEYLPKRVLNEGLGSPMERYSFGSTDYSYIKDFLLRTEFELQMKDVTPKDVSPSSATQLIGNKKV